MASGLLDKERVLYNIGKTQRRLSRGVDDAVLGGAVYKLMDAVSRTILAHKEGGSVADVKGGDGLPLWSAGQAELIEGGLTVMKGGAGEGETTISGESVKSKYGPSLFDSSYDPSKFSLDDIYYNTKKHLADLDEKNKQWASKFGPLAFIKDKKEDYKVPIPTPSGIPIEIPVSPRLILPAANTFLETLRILTTVGPLESGFLRTITSISTAMFEVFSGNWKNGALSLLGVISPLFVYVGTLGKSFRFVYGFINPTIQDQIEDSLFEGGKSMFIGAWLWLFSVVAPSPIREKMEELQNTLVKEMEKFNDQIDAAEKKIQETLAPRGLTMQLRRLEPGMIPSFDDIQNIQSILMMKEIQCLDVTNQTLKPLMEQPVLRLVFEMMGIKTSSEKRAEFCASVPTTLVEAATEGLVGNVTSSQTETTKGSTTETTTETSVNPETVSVSQKSTDRGSSSTRRPWRGGCRTTRRRGSRKNRRARQTKRKTFS
jgi:hypothetical protein